MQEAALLEQLCTIIEDEEKALQVMKLVCERERQIVRNFTTPPRRGRPRKPLPPEFEEVYKAYRAHRITRLLAQERLGISADQFYRMIRKYEQK